MLRPNSIVAECDAASATFVRHGEFPQERPTDQSDEGTHTWLKLYAREISFDDLIQCWNMDLGEVNINVCQPVRCCDRLPINNRQFQHGGQRSINKALTCTGINKGQHFSHLRARYAVPIINVIRVTSNAHL